MNAGNVICEILWTMLMVFNHPIPIEVFQISTLSHTHCGWAFIGWGFCGGKFINCYVFNNLSERQTVGNQHFNKHFIGYEKHMFVCLYMYCNVKQEACMFENDPLGGSYVAWGACLRCCLHWVRKGCVLSYL